jgi:hypothetical protein
MPFNRVNNVKATSMWLALLQSTVAEEEASEEEQKEITPEEAERRKRIKGYLKTISNPKAMKWWIPGLLVVPIPEAGWFLGYVDVAFWATFLYVVGSVFYVVDSFYLWVRYNPAYSDDALSPGVYLNTAAAAIFVINALVCFLDWYLQIQQLSAMNFFVEEELTGGLHVTDVPTKLTWYYFLNNFFFLAAAVIYLVQGMWMEDESTDLQGCAAKL